MILKRLKLFGFMALISTLVLVACQDDFSEEDFLKQQNELAIQKAKRDSAYLASLNQEQAEAYIASLNAAGDLLATTILVREDGAPVSGVTVTFTGGEPEAVGTNGRSQVTLSATTGADGNAVFDRLPIGRHSILLSKAGYATATAQVNFGTPGAPITVQTTVNGNTKTTYLPPIKRFESLTFPMFSTDASSAKTATVKGVVNFESDLTNLTPEIPQNVTIVADLSFLINFGSPSGTVSVTNYQFDAPGLGRAVVNNTTGAYTMRLPASTNGYSNLRLIIPELEGPQRLAINGIDDGSGTVRTIPTGPEYRNIVTKWGANAGGTSSTVTVAGAKIVAPAPPAAGRGFRFTYTAQPRSLGTGTISNTTNQNIGGITYKISSRGSGYTSTPQVAVGTPANLATAEATLRAAVSAITVTSVGTNYSNFTVTLNKVGPAPGFVVTPLGNYTVFQTAGPLPTTIDPALFANQFNFGVNNPSLNIADVSSFTVTLSGNGTGGAITGVVSTALDRVVINNGGVNFTAAPTFTITGGGSTNQATIQVVDFPVQWNASFDNSGNTTPYPVVPSQMYLRFPATAVSGSFDNTFPFDLAPSGGVGAIESFNNSILNLVTVNAGQIVNRNPGTVLRTSNSWSVAPELIVVDNVPVTATGSVNINSLGAVTGVNIFNTGANYNTPWQFTISPTIAGAPGTGAQVLNAHAFNANTGIYSWNGTSILFGGADYLQNLNRKNADSGSNLSGNLPTLQSGKEYIFDIRYGTGFRTVQVN